MLFDAHGHIHFPMYDADRADVITRAQKAGVKMICVGTQVSTSEAAIKLAREYPNDIWATVGFHPNHLAENWHHDKKEQSNAGPEIFNMDALAKLAEDKKVVAIGECGLDYFRLKENPEAQKVKQKEVFAQHIRLAQKLRKPLMMHNRPRLGYDDAYLDALDILETENATVPKINHFYVGSLEATKKLVAAGSYFTFGGVITFARDYDEVIKYIPLEQILLETDAPYVAPMPYRGQRNEPAFIVKTAEKIAEIKGVTFDEVADITSSTAKKIFKI
jgi:TatD DNase family protein